MPPDVERRHAPAARRIASALAQAGTHECIVVSDDGPAPARRPGDLLVTMARGDSPTVRRAGAHGIRVLYADPDEGALVPAALAAAAGADPVLRDPAMLALKAMATRVAATDVPVLIGGPTGTGKEVISRLVHRCSRRATGPFVAVNCAAVPETMMEALLFGHRRGAFTGAAEAGEGFFRAAHGGTLLLDEIAELPLGLQAKLLRALQEGEVTPLGATRAEPVDVRVIACANRDLAGEVNAGRFRADLFYRLSVFPLHLPALRERTADIAPLAFAMLARHRAGAHGPEWISRDAVARLEAHPFPGNVRELENVMRRALILADGCPVLDESHIVFDRAAAGVPPPEPLAGQAMQHEQGNAASLSHALRRSRAAAVADALDACGGDRSRTARMLGISERTLRYRLAEMRSGSVAGGAA
ncbi:sigma-54-dependent Fis family transcriptional regulator [Erythrobacteraceae bacterium CFH 75059]|nr:sigma-54-dependent Fis family transcriptional regulator [Erythrobacteraceae bacterium CFH 75059]